MIWGPPLSGGHSTQTSAGQPSCSSSQKYAPLWRCAGCCPRLQPSSHWDIRSGRSLRGTEETWLRLNQRVFDRHPEAGSIDRADLALRMAQPWFDPNGLLMLVEGDNAIGYCWTKRHGAGVGEIYMIGLAPDHRGRGLGRPLTLAGLAHLSAAGDTVAKLYAEEANRQAVAMYEAMGFEVIKRMTLHRGG